MQWHFAMECVLREQLLYDVKMMRRHLDGRFSDRTFRHFPASQRQVIRHTRRREVVAVFCSCRQPETNDDKMIACDQVMNGTILAA